MRYRFYREHKYISFMLAEFERFIAKIDFKNRTQVEKVKMQLGSLETLMKMHAMHEDKSIHALLRKRGSLIYEAIEDDHRYHEEHLKNLKKKLDDIGTTSNPKEQIAQGYQFYLNFRLFISDNLRHLHDEETVVMAELQRLYSDEELRAVDFNTYAQMTPAQMVHMMEVLFPHMDANDRLAFMRDMKDSEPKKFAVAWNSIHPTLDNIEIMSVNQKLNLQTA